MEPTGYCWSCGRAIPPASGLVALFCNDKCRRRHEREEQAQVSRGRKRGRRDGYGAAGSTH